MESKHVARQPQRIFSAEFKDEAVNLVLETSRPIAQVARELGLHANTLGKWVNQRRREHVRTPVVSSAGLSVDERARLRELDRQVRELQRENEFLKKCAAYFARDPR